MRNFLARGAVMTRKPLLVGRGVSMFTKNDLDFLRAVGISSEPTFDDERLALAQRIAKHRAPTQLVVDPDAAKRELIRLAVRLLLEATGE